ncbi:MAG: YbaB/EbfC family nucleoid-associated protein [Acidimicrobiia bacterium]|jgi:DNA-binding protein YbaB|nr:YbaB/EbfC family nucleoid-associated protein [Acidimicrobiia bacterium]
MTDLPRDDDLDHLVDDDPADELTPALEDLLDEAPGDDDVPHALVPLDDDEPVDLVDDEGGDAAFDVGALLGGLVGDAGGAGIMGSMVEGLQRVQEARDATYEGVAGGGAVRIRATGAMVYEAVELRPDVLDDGDPELVADLVLAALRDLAAKQLEAQTEAMGGMPDLGSLGGALS